MHNFFHAPIDRSTDRASTWAKSCFLLQTYSSVAIQNGPDPRWPTGAAFDFDRGNNDAESLRRKLLQMSHVFQTESSGSVDDMMNLKILGDSTIDAEIIDPHTKHLTFLNQKAGSFS